MILARVSQTVSAPAADIAPGQQHQHAERRRWIAFVVVCLGQLMIVLDVTIVNVALPSIQKDLRFTQANLTWVVDAYLIAFGSFLLLGGRLGDLIGRKRVFLGGLTLFTLASALCGLADDQTLLIAARFVQGLGAAITSAVILAIVVTEFPEPGERAKAMSIYTFVAVGGGSLGLILGGVLTQAVDWHWIFLVNVPIGVLAFVLGSLLIDESEAIGLDRGVDVLGSVLVTAGCALGVYAIVKTADYGWGSAHTLGFGGAALALLAAFGALEARLENPIMPLRILRLRSLVGSSVVRGLLVTGMFGMFFLGSLYFEHVLGYDALQTGLAFLPQTITVAILSLGITARLLARFGAMRLMIPGLALMAVGQLMLANAGEHATFFPTIFVALLVTGLGAGTSFMPLLTIAMADVPPQDAGLGSGVVNVSMQIAAAVGIAVLGALSTHRTKALLLDGHAPKAALTSGYDLAFYIGAGCIVAAIVVALLVLRTPSRPQGAEVGAVDVELEPQPA
jgi:EmrB/QacA subfamily drug resistance transporter